MDWGGGDYRDIMTGVDDMVRRGLADSTKLAFEGWSYGGYMTAWVVSQTSRFKAARMGAGLSDLQSMYGTTDIPGYIGTFFSGVPTQKTLDFYRARSAITFVDQVTTPLLILHGGSDERVPIGQAMEYYRALKDRGKTGAARVLSARGTRARQSTTTSSTRCSASTSGSRSTRWGAAEGERAGALSFGILSEATSIAGQRTTYAASVASLRMTADGRCGSRADERRTAPASAAPNRPRSCCRCRAACAGGARSAARRACAASRRSPRRRPARR